MVDGRSARTAEKVNIYASRFQFHHIGPMVGDKLDFLRQESLIVCSLACFSNVDAGLHDQNEHCMMTIPERRDNIVQTQDKLFAFGRR